MRPLFIICFLHFQSRNTVVFSWDVDSEAPFDYVAVEDLNEKANDVYKHLEDRRHDQFAIEMFGTKKYSMFQKIDPSVTTAFRKTELERLNAQFFRLLDNGKTWRQSYTYMVEGEGLVMRPESPVPRRTKNSSVITFNQFISYFSSISFISYLNLQKLNKPDVIVHDMGVAEAQAKANATGKDVMVFSKEMGKLIKLVPLGIRMVVSTRFM